MFFRKEIYLLECLYFSECDIRMSLYNFLVEKGTTNEVPTQLATGGGWGDPPEYVQMCTRGGEVMPHVYVRTYTIFFHVFGNIFVL